MSTIIPNEHQRKLLELISRELGLDHDDEALVPFLNDRVPQDTFNLCHAAGWLHSRHDDRMDSSAVYITDKGRAVLQSEGK